MVQSTGALAVPFGLMAKQKAGWKQPEPGISDHSMNWMHEYQAARFPCADPLAQQYGGWGTE